VLDTGPGIDEELASRLFGRFERTAGEDRRKTGTGLGLSLTKQLVELHGGTIEAHRRPAGGAELRVLLPASAVIRDAPLPTEPTLRLARNRRPPRRSRAARGSDRPAPRRGRSCSPRTTSRSPR